MTGGRRVHVEGVQKAVQSIVEAQVKPSSTICAAVKCSPNRR